MRLLLVLTLVLTACLAPSEPMPQLPETEAVPTDAPAADGGALTRAVLAGDVEAARAALADGADPNGDGSGPDPMILAAAGQGDDRPDRDAVDSTLVRMLAAAGSDPDLARDNDESALHVAVGRLPVVRALLADGADPNDANNLDRQTPLHVAAAVGHAETVRLLLAADGDPMLRDAAGQTPRDLAADPAVLSLIDAR